MMLRLAPWTVILAHSHQKAWSTGSLVGVEGMGHRCLKTMVEGGGIE
jgi:hypothetical protein